MCFDGENRSEGIEQGTIGVLTRISHILWNFLIISFFPLDRPIRRAVWKMPFRLDEIPFFDTSMMCEPADPTYFTTFEEEHEPWDAPLRRRNNVSSQISNKMNHTPRRESRYSEIGSDDGVLIMEPFSRDPTMPLKRIQPRKYSSPRPSFSQPMEDSHNLLASPTPYSPPNFNILKSRFNETNGKTDSRVFKKRAAPPPPQDGNFDIKTPSKKGPAPQPFQKQDPLLKEMESYGKNKVKITIKVKFHKAKFTRFKSFCSLRFQQTKIHRSTSSPC